MYFTVAVQSMRRACLSDSLACWINSSCLQRSRIVASSDAGSTHMGVGAYQSEAEAQVHQGQSSFWVHRRFEARQARDIRWLDCRETCGN